MSTHKGQGFIDYIENKQKGHKLITKIYKDNKEDFVPMFKLKRQKNKGGANEESKQSAGGQIGEAEYPKIQIDEVY